MFSFSVYNIKYVFFFFRVYVLCKMHMSSVTSSETRIRGRTRRRREVARDIKVFDLCIFQISSK